MDNPIRRTRVFAACLLLILALPAVAPVRAADVVTYLGIEGMLGAGSAGNYPLDAEFSWISHRFPDNAQAHIWTLAPGSDGGIIINTPQPGKGQITAPRAMYNINSWLFSINTGIQSNPLAEVLDFSNMRLYWGGDVYDFGFGTTTSGLIPHVAGPDDVLAANGWWLEATSGKYHLIFRGNGQCAGCVLTVHLVGQMTSAVLGDVSPAGAPDGQINAADLLRLMRFVEVLEVPSEQDALVADFNGDSVLDVRDVLALSQELGY